ncbi:hypothetical protein [Poritiphilus flavus]|uniref:Lipoprotein n=1 Tax=Poritiphilus flavus TaxID=2697053 RepID=A0A6L9E8R1_9FLAO|nr:hypothetical protein [Poritiphilus flavus]NAS10972.1 hypothetical protein [Poritiphilus flavus]
MRAIRFKKWIFPLILSLFLAGACKQSGKSGSDKPEHEDQLVVQLIVKVKQDDKLELYYRKGKETYNSERRLDAPIRGSEEFQTVNFVFEILEFPSHVRIDLGENPQQPEIEIQQLAFKYNEAEHIFTPEELKKYFRPNSWLQFDFQTLSGKGRVVDGKYDPFLSSNEISYFVNKLILY